MKRSHILLSTALVAVLAVSGCARDISGGSYVASKVGEVQETLAGKVISVRQVRVESEDQLEDNTLGLAAGGIAGGVAGNSFGKGTGKGLATVGGALAGATLGALAQKELKNQMGMEYVVKLDRGDLLTVVQGTDEPIGVGQRVYVVKSDRGRSRVVAY
jgi:outer membrane lipoprotein SlyB